ncbi:MAG: hypothetical protein AAF685_16435 [Cyanobacteria bacterium P01_C01_bin.89]
MSGMGLPEFLTAEESAKVDAALLSSPEKFLTRLTLSSFKLLTFIAESEGVAIADLTQEQIIAWFERDAKTKREQGVDAAVLKW